MEDIATPTPVGPATTTLGMGTGSTTVDPRELRPLEELPTPPTTTTTRGPTKGGPTTPTTVMEDIATPTPVGPATTTLGMGTGSTTVDPRELRPLEELPTPPTTTTTR